MNYSSPDQEMVLQLSLLTQVDLGNVLCTKHLLVVAAGILSPLQPTQPSCSSSSLQSWIYLLIRGHDVSERLVKKICACGALFQSYDGFQLLRSVLGILGFIYSDQFEVFLSSTKLLFPNFRLPFLLLALHFQFCHQVHQQFNLRAFSRSRVTTNKHINT